MSFLATQPLHSCRVGKLYGFWDSLQGLHALTLSFRSMARTGIGCEAYEKNMDFFSYLFFRLHFNCISPFSFYSSNPPIYPSCSSSSSLSFVRRWIFALQISLPGILAAHGLIISFSQLLLNRIFSCFICLCCLFLMETLTAHNLLHCPEVEIYLISFEHIVLVCC